MPTSPPSAPAAAAASSSPKPAAAAAAASGAAGDLRDPSVLLQQLSAMAEDDDNWEASPAYLNYLEAKYRDIECPLFMDSIPADPSSVPELHALQLLAYDGETPESVARRYKEQGREFLQKAQQERKQGQILNYQQLVKEAEMAYERALAQGIKDKAELSILHSNVALCRLKRGDLLRCIDSSRAAIKLNPQNLKGYLRGAKASLHLELHAQAERFAAMGLQAAAATAAATATATATAAAAATEAAAATAAAAEGNAAACVDAAAEKELRALQEEAQQRHQRHQQRRREAEAAEKALKKSSCPSAGDVFKKRGIRTCPAPPGLAEVAAQVPEVSVHLELLTGDFFLLLPVLLLLDEYSRADAIADADERLSLLQQLKTIFPSKYTLMQQQHQQQQQQDQQQQQQQQVEGEPTEFPSWDHEKKYVLENLVAYYECGLPGGVLLSFPMNLPLALLLQYAKRFAGIAAFHILVKGSPAHTAFVKEARIEKLAL